MRFFVYIIFALAACQPTASVSTTEFKVLTYQEFVDYPVDCKYKIEQLVELKGIQKLKNFDPNPDLLNDEDHSYNSRLKATIWWYAYRCDEL